MVAILDFQISISQHYEVLQGWNSECKLFTPKSIIGTYFQAIVAILDFV